VVTGGGYSYYASCCNPYISLRTLQVESRPLYPPKEGGVSLRLSTRRVPRKDCFSLR